MNEELILEFKNAIRDLLQIPDVSILNCKEDEKQFNQKIIPNQVSEIQNIINLISPYIDVFKIYVNLNICNCSAVVDVLSKNQVIVTAGWEEDTSLTYDLPYPDAEADIYNISQKLRLNTTLQTDDLYNALFDMENRGFNIVCSIFIILDKINLLKRLDLPAGINCVLYVYDEKFLDTLKNKGIRKLDEIFVLDNVYILLVLLGNTKGYCEGKYLKILGLDYWNDVNIIRVPEDNQNYVDNILKFRNDECQWEFPMQSIAYYSYVTMLSMYLIT